MNFQKLREKKEIGKIIFLYFPKIGRIRTNSDEIQKIKPLVFCSMNFCADGFGRVFFFGFSKNFGKLGKLQKITDEFRGFFIFSPPFQFSRQRYDALQILVGRGMSTNGFRALHPRELA